MDSEHSRTQWSPIVRIWVGFWTVFMMVLSVWLFFHVQNVSESLLAAGIALLLHFLLTACIRLPRLRLMRGPASIPAARG